VRLLTRVESVIERVELLFPMDNEGLYDDDL
jgi:hypothetical protein